LQHCTSLSTDYPGQHCTFGPSFALVVPQSSFVPQLFQHHAVLNEIHASLCRMAGPTLLCIGCFLQAQMAEVSRACCSKEAECRQLQDCSQEQQQKLAEAEAAAEQQAKEMSALQVCVGAKMSC
jgi:hypothetical protein